MNFLKLEINLPSFNKKNNIVTEKKSCNPEIYIGGYSLGNLLNNGQLLAGAAINYYNTISPVAKSINVIAREFSTISPMLFNKKTGEFVKEADMSKFNTNILKLLENPNNDKTGIEFLRELASFFYITGNAYLVTQSFDGNEPDSLFCINPQDVMITSAQDNTPYSYHITFFGKNLIFKKNEEFEYINENSNGYTYELYHIRNFNANSSGRNLFGQSPLTCIYYEIDQFLSSNVHNLSVLKKGMRPSGAVIVDENLSDEQNQALKAQLKSFYSGSENASNVMVFGQDVKSFIPLSINPKDMDFKELKEQVQNSIYVNLDIPLPFVGVNTTYSNYNESKYVLYDSNILPFAKNIYAELNLFLLKKYKGMDNFKLAYDEDDIPALQVRRNQEADRKIKTGKLTDNECRRLLGSEYGDIEGGDVVKAPQNLITVGQPLEKKSMTVNKDDFKTTMKRQGYSDNKINDYVKKIYEG